MNPSSITSILFLFILLLSCGCQPLEVLPALVSPSEVSTIETQGISASQSLEHEQLTYQEIRTLRSLEQLDEYPLYRLSYYADYQSQAAEVGPKSFARQQRMGPAAVRSQAPYRCSLFAVFGDPGGFIFGRNFDWRFSPAVVLHTDPPGGFASFTMVDLDYLVGTDRARQLADLELTELEPLLRAPYWPFDGMNERGLAIGMAAVPDSSLPFNPNAPTIGSLEIMRLILDQAQTVQEAIAIFESFNLDMLGGPSLHYLVADATGTSALIEFHGGELLVYPGRGEWQAATNFLQATHDDSMAGVCPRYDLIEARLMDSGGELNPEAALALLQDASQDGQGSSTQWSVVYDLSNREILIVMGRSYDRVYRLNFDSDGP